MAELAPVRTVADLRQLDDGEILKGYSDGFHGSRGPGSDRSQAYWHGWRNGQINAVLLNRMPRSERWRRVGDPSASIAPPSRGNRGLPNPVNFTSAHPWLADSVDKHRPRAY